MKRIVSDKKKKKKKKVEWYSLDEWRKKYLKELAKQIKKDKDILFVHLTEETKLFSLSREVYEKFGIWTALHGMFQFAPLPGTTLHINPRLWKQVVPYISKRRLAKLIIESDLEFASP